MLVNFKLTLCKTCSKHSGQDSHNNGVLNRVHTFSCRYTSKIIIIQCKTQIVWSELNQRGKQRNQEKSNNSCRFSACSLIFLTVPGFAIAVAIHSTYLSTHLFADLAQNGNTIVSVYEYMRSHGFASFSDADMELTVTLLNEKQRKLLGITGCETGLTLSSRCIEPQSGQLLAYSSIVYRCDKFKFLL